MASTANLKDNHMVHTLPLNPLEAKVLEGSHYLAHTQTPSIMGRVLEPKNFQKLNTEVHVWYYPNVYISQGRKNRVLKVPLGGEEGNRTKAGPYPSG